MDKRILLSVLPPMQGKRIVFEQEQDSNDIIKEVLRAHSDFRSDYKKIAGFFVGDAPRRLYNFLRNDFKYSVESKDDQTTRSPSAILSMSGIDCKHYAGFIGGVLDAIGTYDWCYRFAGYGFLETSPVHVFVVVKKDGKEIWVDPCLDAFDKRNPYPTLKIDKKPMALSRIYGPGSARVAGLVYPSGYRNPLIEWYNNLIFGSLPYGQWPCIYTVDGEVFVNFPTVSAESIRLKYNDQESLYRPQLPKLPQGLEVTYPDTWMGKPVPADLLKPKITSDYRMIIVTPDGNLDMLPPPGTVETITIPFTGMKYPGTNTYIPGTQQTITREISPSAYTAKILTEDNGRLLKLVLASAGAIQMAYCPIPDADDLQRWTHRVLDLRLDNNYIVSMDVKTLAGSFIEGIKDAIEWVGENIIKFIGIIPRTAFLQLVRLNLRGMATNLYKNLQSSESELIYKKWEGFGGERNSLLNAARDGAAKNALLGHLGNHIGELAVTAASLLAAASPVIALLAKWLKSIGSPELNKIVDNTVNELNKLLIASGESPIDVAQSVEKPLVSSVPGGGSVMIPYDRKLNSLEMVAIGAGVLVIGSMVMNKKRRAV